MSQQEYKISVTFTVNADTRRWAYIHVMAALSAMTSGQIESFDLGDISLSDSAPEPEPGPRREAVQVQSWSDPDVSYLVMTVNGEPVSCNCGDFVYREAHNEGGSCKHMREVTRG